MAYLASVLQQGMDAALVVGLAAAAAAAAAEIVLEVSAPEDARGSGKLHRSLLSPQLASPYLLLGGWS